MVCGNALPIYHPSCSPRRYRASICSDSANRRSIERSWKGDPGQLAQRLEQYDRKWQDLLARTSKSDPFVLAAILGVGRVPRLRRQHEDAIKSEEEYRKYRELNPQWLGFAVMERTLDIQKKKRDTKPATTAKRRKGKLTRDKVLLALTRSDMNQRDIAEKLNIDVRTVRRHQVALKESGHIVRANLLVALASEAEQTE